MAGSKFIVFGGQVDGEFLNDVWSFDLNSRMPISFTLLSYSSLSLVRTKALWELLEPVSGEVPARRTGHICITFGDKIIMCVQISFLEPLILDIHITPSSFGGTDGQYHYNDTWSFDLQTRQWSELQCIGFIPSPREGHAAAIVDDVIYIFGGRGVDGKDLSDLSAFRISSEYLASHLSALLCDSTHNRQTSAGTCSRTWVLLRRVARATRWHQ